MSNRLTNNGIISPLHGHVFYPPSRAYLAWQAGELDLGALNQRESGKFFPQTSGNLADSYAAGDVFNSPPPPDGKIASADQSTGKKMDEPGSHYPKHQVQSAQVLDVSWNFTANHKSRRWNYFLTKVGWDPSKVLSRAQFEAEPFYTVQINLQPHWEHSDAMMPPSPTTHGVPLPERVGYHVLLAVWEVADTAAAFYQVVDLDFSPSEGGGENPTTPTGLTASQVTDKQVVLTWNSVTGPSPIKTYRIVRDGITTIDVAAPLLTWTDNSVEAEGTYNYFICAIDEKGNYSTPSLPIVVRTLAEGGVGAPPTAPVALHGMSVTANSVDLMWGGSVGASPISHYLVYRDGAPLKQVIGTQLSVADAGLTPNTVYRYFVAARDVNGLVSVPSNVLTVTTKVEEGGGGDYPEWKLNVYYGFDTKVSYLASNWKCIQAHTSYVQDWAPGTSETLWVPFSGR